MLYRIAADGLVLFHLSFILFILFGGLLVLKWRCLVWWHLPAHRLGKPAAPCRRAKRLWRWFHRTLRLAGHLPVRSDTGHTTGFGQRSAADQRAGLSSIVPPVAITPDALSHRVWTAEGGDLADVVTGKPGSSNSGVLD